MAIAATDFTVVKRFPVAPSLYIVTGLYTCPASYTNGGEQLTTAIANGTLGINQVYCLNFAPAVSSDGTLGGFIGFDHTSGTGYLGKIHLFAGVAAHAHDYLYKGGQSTTNDEPIFLTDPGSAQNIGKNAATDRTIAGGSATTGGVQTSTAVGHTTELPSTSGALSGYKAAFFLLGV